MDVRMEKLKMEVKAKMQAGETKESLFYVDWDQLEELGITFQKGRNEVVAFCMISSRYCEQLILLTH